MQKIRFLLFLFFANTFFAQQSDFSNIDFTKADFAAKSYNNKKLLELHKFTLKLTQNLDSDVEKFRAIYFWICHNIANDYRLYAQNSKKRKQYLKDSVKLEQWNSSFKKKLFKKLLKKKKTICTGYAYLLKEMASVVDIEVKMVNGIGRTSEVDLESIEDPNHTWNIVKLNNKWYLCDPTWATGISFPDENKFVFNYNNGYFLTEPALFFQSHFPLNSNYSLLDINTYTFQKFTEMPLLYAEAYKVLSEHILPEKMYHEIEQNDLFIFKYKLKKEIDLSKISFILSNNAINKKIKPNIKIDKNILTLTHVFKKRGFYDLHLYIKNKIIATYTFKIIKKNNEKNTNNNRI